MRLGKSSDLAVPAGAVQEEAFDVGSVTRRLLVLLVIQHFEVEDQMIDRNRVLSGVILLHARQKRLGEVEAGHPENWRGAFFVPVLEKQSNI